MEEHGGVQADMVLEKEQKVLHLGPQEAEGTVCHTEVSLSIEDFKVNPYSGTVSTTRPQLVEQSHTHTFITKFPPEAFGNEYRN